MPTSIPNPPVADPGYVAQWDGTEWTIVDLNDVMVPQPAQPIGLPTGYTTEWNGTEWVTETVPPVGPPTPEEVTTNTLNIAFGQVTGWQAMLASPASTWMSSGQITQVQTYIGQMMAVIVQAQADLAAGIAYDPVMPTAPNIYDGSFLFTAP